MIWGRLASWAPWMAAGSGVDVRCLLAEMLTKEAAFLFLDLPSFLVERCWMEEAAIKAKTIAMVAALEASLSSGFAGRLGARWVKREVSFEGLAFKGMEWATMLGAISGVASVTLWLRREQSSSVLLICFGEWEREDAIGETPTETTLWDKNDSA